MIILRCDGCGSPNTDGNECEYCGRGANKVQSGMGEPAGRDVTGDERAPEPMDYVGWALFLAFLIGCWVVPLFFIDRNIKTLIEAKPFPWEPLAMHDLLFACWPGVFILVGVAMVVIALKWAARSKP